MPRFDDLPNELLAIISDFIAVADFENFVQINRTVHVLAQERLKEHRRLSRQYKTLTVPTLSLKSTYDLLKNFTTTDHGHYVRSFLINKSSYYHFWQPGQSDQPLTPEDIEWLLHGIPARDFFAQPLEEAEGPDTWGAGVLSALILLHTPNLHHLELPFVRGELRWLQAILRQAVSGGSHAVLGKLTSASLSHSDQNLDDCRDLIRIPSMRKLQLNRLETWTPRGQASATCPLEKVELEHLSIKYHATPQALCGLLQETNHLTTLDLRCQVTYDPKWAKLSTYVDMLSSVRSVLRKLIILYPTLENRTIALSPGSFLDFTALEYFETYFDGIYPQYLPSSLQSIKLHGKACCINGTLVGGKRYSASLFIEAVLEGHKSGTNPNLMHLEFTEKLAPRYKRNREMLKELMLQCAAFSIQINAPNVVENVMVSPEHSAPS
ncbi:MAG: hypothetical protein Q9169_007688 [Polycauliona sp. 2 TL-2023]